MEEPPPPPATDVRAQFRQDMWEWLDMIPSDELTRLITPTDSQIMQFFAEVATDSAKLPVDLVAFSEPESSISPLPSPSCYLPLPPSLIACSQWEKEECIGSGSFGHVYHGFNSEHGQFCAIKEVLVVLNDPRSKEQLKQLNQEIYCLKQLSHPNIVQYYGSILISTLTQVHTSRAGSPCWMASEVMLSAFSGKGYNLSADIWSLGCTVVEMAMGKHPLQGLEPVQAMFKIGRDTYEPEIPDNLSDEGKDFLLRCLRRDPRSRPTATQLMDHPFVREYHPSV